MLEGCSSCWRIYFTVKRLLTLANYSKYYVMEHEMYQRNSLKLNLSQFYPFNFHFAVCL